jgi:hypothetical protein
MVVIPLQWLVIQTLASIKSLMIGIRNPKDDGWITKMRGGVGE